MANRPTDFINRAELGILVKNNWLQFYPNYNVNFITQADFGVLVQNFYDKATQNANQDTIKKDNTDNLKNINAELKKNCVRLKEYIRDAYDVNIDAMYAAYGLQKVNNNYTFPIDNDTRLRSLSVLLLKLQEPNNPLANRKLGLAYWEDIITRHSMAWNLSKNIKSTKARLSQECRDLHKQVGDKLSRLFRQIAIDNDRAQVASIRRTFGFLGEVYK